jgi:hypothetical protein
MKKSRFNGRTRVQKPSARIVRVKRSRIGIEDVPCKVIKKIDKIHRFVVSFFINSYERIVLFFNRRIERERIIIHNCIERRTREEKVSPKICRVIGEGEGREKERRRVKIQS